MFAVLSEQLLSNLLFLIYLHTVKTLVWTFIFLSLDYCNIPFTGSSKYKSISLLLRILLQTPFLVHALSQVYLFEYFSPVISCPSLSFLKYYNISPFLHFRILSGQSPPHPSSLHYRNTVPLWLSTPCRCLQGNSQSLLYVLLPTRVQKAPLKDPQDHLITP